MHIIIRYAERRYKMTKNFQTEQELIDLFASLKELNDEKKKIEERKKALNDEVAVTLSFSQPDAVNALGENFMPFLKAYVQAETDINKSISADKKANKDNMDLVKKAMAEVAHKDALSQGVIGPDDMSVEIRRSIPGYGTLKVVEKREKVLTDSQVLKAAIIQKLVDEGKLDLLDVNQEAYFKYDDQVMKETGKHAEGVYVTESAPKVTTTFKK